MVILAVAGIYSIEYNTGMMRLLKTTPLGRKDLRSAKLWIGAGLVTVIFAMVYGSELYRILSAFGTKGWNCSVACMSHIPMKLSGLTVADYLILILAMRYIGLLLLSDLPARQKLYHDNGIFGCCICSAAGFVSEWSADSALYFVKSAASGKYILEERCVSIWRSGYLI